MDNTQKFTDIALRHKAAERELLCAVLLFYRTSPDLKALMEAIGRYGEATVAREKFTGMTYEPW